MLRGVREVLKKIVIHNLLKHLQNKRRPLLGLFLIALLVSCVYLLVAKLWTIFSSVDPRLGVGLIVACTTVIVSVVSVLISKHLETKATIQAHLREKKTPTYEKIIKFMFRLVFSEKLGRKKPSDKEMMEFMAEITQELVVWGSDEMLYAFHEFRTASIENADNDSANVHDILLAVEDFLLAIRKDLGHDNKKISRGKILGLFINDLSNEIKQSK